MHVNDPTTLASPVLVFLMGLWTALTGARNKRDERKRQDAKDEAEARAATLRLETERADRHKADCDMWRARAGVSETEIETRNAKWSACRTNHPEVADLIAVPGALSLLRDHRDKYDTAMTAQPVTEKTI